MMLIMKKLGVRNTDITQRSFLDWEFNLNFSSQQNTKCKFGGVLFFPRKHQWEKCFIQVSPSVSATAVHQLSDLK